MCAANDCGQRQFFFSCNLASNRLIIRTLKRNYINVDTVAGWPSFGMLAVWLANWMLVISVRNLANLIEIGISMQTKNHFPTEHYRIHYECKIGAINSRFVHCHFQLK